MARVIECATAGDLVGAALASRWDDVEAVLVQDIDLQGRLLNPGTSGPLTTSFTIHAERPDLVVAFNRYPTYDTLLNDVWGICGRWRRLTLRGFELRNWEQRGGLVGVDGNIGYIRDMTFRNVGQWAMPPPGKLVADDAWDLNYTQVIGAFHAETETVEVTNCQFFDCARGSTWNHCVYLSNPQVVRVVKNFFSRCGQEINVAGCPVSTVVDNQVQEPGTAVNAWRWMDHPMWLVAGKDPTRRQTVLGNRLSGTFTTLYYGVFNGQVVNLNDYRGVQLGYGYDRWPVAIRNGGGNPTLSWEDWQALGLDLNSQLPETN